MIILGLYFLSLTRGPFWGVIAYTFVYFIPPVVEINWWADYLPEFRWSLMSAGILIASSILHREKLSKHKFGNVYLVFLFYALTQIIIHTTGVAPEQSGAQSHALFSYCIILPLFIKSFSVFEQFRSFVLVIIGLSASYAIKARFDGKFYDGRLNNVGPVDAHTSNEVGLMLAAIIPLTIPFIIHGKRFEKLLCSVSLILIVNTFLLTESRGALVALVLSFIYAFLFVADKKVKKYLLTLIICAIPLVILLGDKDYYDRISTLWKDDRSSEQAVNTLSSGRTEIWKYGWEMFIDYPFGAGPEGFKELARFYMPDSVLTYHPGAEYGVRGAHNTYLMLLVETGIFGFLIFMLCCFRTLYILSKTNKGIRKREPPGTFLDLFVISFSMSFFCLMVGGMFGGHLYYEFFWWQIAFAVLINSFLEVKT